MRSTRLVAESLRVMSVPVAHELPPARLVTSADLQQLSRDAAQPDRADAEAPGWLRAGQVDTWRRVVAAIDGWNGAILAEPVGSGKSWIALAAAKHFGQVPLVIGPAGLESQWRQVGNRSGIPIRWHSHERLSRGGPPQSSGFVIIDEAHRFRHSNTRRVSTLAPWLVGRSVLLLTATPIVNRRADLLALLHLVFPDDALILDGVRSLRELESVAVPPPALARLVIRSRRAEAAVPQRDTAMATAQSEQARGRVAVGAIESLVLSEVSTVRRLLATVLLDAAASSDAAWRAALRRYRALLLQSRDAGGLSRHVLRQFAGPALDQLVMWPLLGEQDHTLPPPAHDLPVIDKLLAAPLQAEAWMEEVAGIVADGRPTICFTRHRATAAALVRHLGDEVAWVTGSASGIGAHRFDRDAVLAAFGPRRDAWQVLRKRPDTLVCTEVLAEGLDLQGANRVIHLDLPWHPARLEQRNGRVQRIGQLASEVRVVTRHPPHAIEVALRIGHAIRRKATVADRWLAALTLEARHHDSFPPGTWCAVANRSAHQEAMALVVLRSGRRHGVIRLALQDAIWQAVPGGLADMLDQIPAGQVTRFEREQCNRLARRATWKSIELTRVSLASRPRLVARLLEAARTARIAHDHRALERLDALLGVANRQVPRGLELQLDALREAPDTVLTRATLPALPALARPVPVGILMVLFRSAGSPLR